MKIIYLGGMPDGTIKGEIVFKRGEAVEVPDELAAELLTRDDADPTPENPLQRKPIWEKA